MPNARDAVVKTVAEKLLIKSGSVCWATPVEQAKLLEPLPEGARWARRLADAAVGVIFVSDEASARATLAKHRGQLLEPEILWVAYPKGNRSDVNRDTLWPIVAEYGMRPVGQVAVDDVWSALRFRALKPGEPTFSGGR